MTKEIIPTLKEMAKWHFIIIVHLQVSNDFKNNEPILENCVFSKHTLTSKTKDWVYSEPD